MEWKNDRLQLPNVTLMAMTSVQLPETIKAMQYSMRSIDFGDVVLITHRKPFFLPKEIRYAHTSKLTDINCFNYKMLYELGDYIHTDYVMIVHADGFVVHPEMWRDEFLDYDYIGSPWPIPKDDFTYRDAYGRLSRVGNCVGIRSKRLVDFPRQANLPFEADHDYFNEDGFLCVKNRHLVEAAGMRIAPIEVAKYYAHETMIPEIEGITPFAFHKWAGTNAQYPKYSSWQTSLSNFTKRVERKLRRMMSK